MSVPLSLKMQAMTPRMLHVKRVRCKRIYKVIQVSLQEKKKKGSTKDPIDDSFSKNMERFYDICDATKQEIGKVAIYFQYVNANIGKNDTSMRT